MSIKPTQGWYEMKLDFTDVSKEQMTQYQETLITTISRLKHGLFNAEAALGLKASLDLLSDLHIQTSAQVRLVKEELDTYNVSVDIIDEAE